MPYSVSSQIRFKTAQRECTESAANRNRCSDREVENYLNKLVESSYSEQRAVAAKKSRSSFIEQKSLIIAWLQNHRIRFAKSTLSILQSECANAYHPMLLVIGRFMLPKGFHTHLTHR